MYYHGKNGFTGNEKRAWISVLIIMIVFPTALLCSTASPYTIQMVSGEFTPPRDAGSIETLSQQTRTVGPLHCLIQLEENPTDAEWSALDQAGVRLLTPIPDRAWLATITRPVNAVRAQELRIRWAGALTISDKLHPRILRREFDPWTEYQDGKVIVVVHLFSDVPLMDGEDLAVQYDAVTGDLIETLNAWIMAVDPDRIEEIASEDAVMWIEVLPPPLTSMNDVARQVVGANTVQASPYNLDGSGITVCVYDGGMVDGAHLDFAGRLTVVEGGATANHATHVAGSVGGDGANSSGQYRGMAPGCDLLSYEYESCTPYCLYNSPQDIEANYNQAMNTYGAHLTTNSIGSNIAYNGYDCSWEGDYETTSQLLDNIVGGSLGSPLLVVFAAGNERGPGTCGTTYETMGVPAGAKNIITVGATDDYDEITYFSSWGPTDDGRIKPEVCAPGYNIYSCLPGNTYGNMSGTSMATPITSGCIALILEQYAITFSGAPNPLPSTIKAILMNTALDLGNTGPDYVYGFGRVDVQAAVDAVMNQQFLEDALTTGQSDAHTFNVESGTTSLRVSLAWNDPAAAPMSNPTLINDLDLTLESPSHTIYYPYILDPANPSNPATTGADHRNNYEQVVVTSPETGQWTINVSYTSLPTSPQNYSLVASETLGAGVSFIEGHITAQATGDSIPADIRIVGGVQQATADSTGYYVFGVTGDSTYTLEASYFGCQAIQQAIYVPVDSTVTLDFVLPPAATGTLEGTVYDPHSDPIPGAEIVVMNTPLDPMYSGPTGFYQNSSIPGGASYDISVSADGFEGDTATVFVPVGGTVVQNFTLQAMAYFSDFESTSDWTTDPSHTASTGDFVAIDPNPTEYQNGDDTTPPPGTIAWVTAQNSALGTDDVDNGVAATRSPVIDLSYLSGARLVMNWFHGQRDVGDDSGDFFRIDVSNDGGSTFPLNLVSIGDVNHTPEWYTIDVELHTLITLTSQMVIRVQASDATADGDIVEAGIDDVRIISAGIGIDLSPPIITVHPLGPTSDPVGPYSAQATVTDLSGVDTVEVYHGNDGINFTAVTMDNGGSGNLYSGDIPGYPVGSTVYYFIRAVDASVNANAGNSDTLTFQVLPGGSLVYVLNEDFESDEGGLTETGIDWEWGIPTSGPGSAHSGTKLWATALAGTYSDNSDSRLITPTLSLTNLVNPILTYWQWYQFEYSTATFWDGGNIKISSDGGPFELVTPNGGYDGVIDNTVNILHGEPVYGRTDLGNFWHQDTVDLAAYAGHDIQIRFHFGSDAVTVELGWYLDDVVVQGYLPGPPPEVTDLVAQLVSDDISLTWTDPGGTGGFRIYRSTDPGFTPIPGDLLDTVTAPPYVDADVVSSGNNYFYRITVLSVSDGTAITSYPDQGPIKVKR